MNTLATAAEVAQAAAAAAQQGQPQTNADGDDDDDAHTAPAESPAPDAVKKTQGHAHNEQEEEKEKDGEEDEEARLTSTNHHATAATAATDADARPKRPAAAAAAATDRRLDVESLQNQMNNPRFSALLRQQMFNNAEQYPHFHAFLRQRRRQQQQQQQEEEAEPQPQQPSRKRQRRRLPSQGSTATLQPPPTMPTQSAAAKATANDRPQEATPTATAAAATPDVAPKPSPLPTPSKKQRSWDVALANPTYYYYNAKVGRSSNRAADFTVQELLDMQRHEPSRFDMQLTWDGTSAATLDAVFGHPLQRGGRNRRVGPHPPPEPSFTNSTQRIREWRSLSKKMQEYHLGKQKSATRKRGRGDYSLDEDDEDAKTPSTLREARGSPPAPESLAGQKSPRSGARSASHASAASIGKLAITPTKNNNNNKKHHSTTETRPSRRTVSTRSSLRQSNPNPRNPPDETTTDNEHDAKPAAMNVAENIKHDPCVGIDLKVLTENKRKEEWLPDVMEKGYRLVVGEAMANKATVAAEGDAWMLDPLIYAGLFDKRVGKDLSVTLYVFWPVSFDVGVIVYYYVFLNLSSSCWLISSQQQQQTVSCSCANQKSMDILRCTNWPCFPMSLARGIRLLRGGTAFASRAANM